MNDKDKIKTKDSVSFPKKDSIVDGVNIDEIKREADALFEDFEKKNEENFPSGKERSGTR